jgi:sugar phosphate isomerase/epimerase
VRPGVDSYTYHRLFGEVRRGETPATTRWRDGVGDVVDEAMRIGAGTVSLETCFIAGPPRAAERSLADAGSRVEVVLSWGAPEGLRYGTDAGALRGLVDWLDVAHRASIELVRIVLGAPAQRGWARTHAATCADSLRVAAEAARARGVRLAIENHGDITADDLHRLLQGVGDSALGVCFDTANALRVGDEVVAAARLLGPRVWIVHLKDIEDPTRERDPISGPCSVPYGSGVVPLDETLDVLALAGFDGPVCVELGQLRAGDDEREMARGGLDWLRRRMALLDR